MGNTIINTNVLALNAHRNLRNVGTQQSQVSNRLSSGLRINTAADDAAGLAISERMRSQIRGLDQASRNSQDGMSLMQVAEGAMIEIGNMMQRIRELTVAAANDTQTASERHITALEIHELFVSMNDMAEQTQFNQRQLLNGQINSVDERGLHLQVGANSHESMWVEMGDVVRDVHNLRMRFEGDAGITLPGAAADGTYGTDRGPETWNSREDFAAGFSALTGEQISALISAPSVDGVTPPGPTPWNPDTWDGMSAIPTGWSIDMANSTIEWVDRLSDTSNADVVGWLLYQGLAQATANGTVSAGLTVGGTNPNIIMTATGTWDAAAVAFATAVAAAFAGVGLGVDAAGAIERVGGFDPEDDLVWNGQGTPPFSWAVDTDASNLVWNEPATPVAVMADLPTWLAGWDGTGTMPTPGADDPAIDWANTTLVLQAAPTAPTVGTIVEFLGDVLGVNLQISGGSGNLQVQVMTANGINYNWEDVVTVTGTVDLTELLAASAFTTQAALEGFLGEFGFEFYGGGANLAAALTFDYDAIDLNSLAAHLGAGGSVPPWAVVDMENSVFAFEPVAPGEAGEITIDDSLFAMSSHRALFGAYSNRLQFTVYNLDNASENQSAAEARIRDADMAREMMRFVQLNVLQQAAISMLAQANQAPQSVLQLLG